MIVKKEYVFDVHTGTSFIEVANYPDLRFATTLSINGNVVVRNLMDGRQNLSPFLKTVNCGNDEWDWLIRSTASEIEGRYGYIPVHPWFEISGKYSYDESDLIFSQLIVNNRSRLLVNGLAVCVARIFGGDDWYLIANNQREESQFPPIFLTDDYRDVELMTRIHLDESSEWV